ncbi:MAG TPA: peptidase T [Ferruginibacter sp.]|jgi:tripeptide aminopeptidase|nr:peptidase T [Ferruginibacter sp.]HNA15975.1 peptidase T [Ferruginibacter sp.]HNF01741.1 peptidase T [Ferruginibacter sp.]HNL64575.1 peptidase T [Ferruginibacter sp.]HNN71152.1 peptidase T [Ferruginibacter sp.]
MIQISPDSIADRFMRYVRIDTQSDPNSSSHPSSGKQKDLSKLLHRELLGMGITNASTDEFGYVYASIPSNSDKKNIPAICFCAHVDTAPDCSGTDVKPIHHRYYDGKDIVLPDDPSQVLRMSDSPYLKNHINSGVITASGLTLLGADDKSGVAAIMEAAMFFIQNPAVKHGDIRILFTPDEEIGQGTAKVDMQKLGASFGYTLDGGEAGDLEDETFSADGALVTIQGVIVHPGYAKDKMVNALKVAGAILDALPKKEWSPETTEKREGFVHPVAVNGIAEKATIQFIVRDFTVAGLQQHHQRLKKIAEDTVAKFPGATMEYTSQEQYRNMKEVLDKYPQVVAYAEEAIQRAGLTVRKESIRGGTDGSRFSYMGMPCPNIFTGMQNIHSKLEWIGTKDMAKAAETIVHLSMIWEERS